MNERSRQAQALRPAPSNLEQLRGWDGETGDYWTVNADRYDEGVAAYQQHLLAAAAISPADRVLDVGCGTGQTTRDAARQARNGAALGVDLSAQMLELASRRAEREGVTNVSFLQADAQQHPFDPHSFNVIVSRHGSMFFGDPAAAFTNLARSVRPGGRLVLLTWQPYARQEWLRTFRRILGAGRDLPEPSPVAPGPVALSDPHRVHTLLTAAGFTNVALDGLIEPMYYGPDPDDAARFVSGQFAGLLQDLDSGSRERAVQALRADMAAHATDRGVQYQSAAWLVQAQR